MEMRHIGTTLSLIVAIATATLTSPPPASAQESQQDDKQQAAESAPRGGVIGLGAAVYPENSHREGTEVRQNEETDESVDYSPDGFLNGSLWYLRPLIPRVRAGGGLRYHGSYEMMPEPQEDQDPDDVEAYELGQMTTLFARAEWLIPFTDQMQLILGGEAGGTILFPDGDFRSTIEEMADQEISVYEGPRFGAMLAPLVGGRWKVDSRLAFRLDFSVQWQRLYLMNVDDTVDGVDYSRTWTSKILRYNIGLGMEVSL